MWSWFKKERTVSDFKYHHTIAQLSPLNILDFWVLQNWKFILTKHVPSVPPSPSPWQLLFCLLSLWNIQLQGSHVLNHKVCALLCLLISLSKISLGFILLKQVSELQSFLMPNIIAWCGHSTLCLSVYHDNLHLLVTVNYLEIWGSQSGSVFFSMACSIVTYSFFQLQEWLGLHRSSLRTKLPASFLPSVED